jgi:hypothetical protein
MITDTRKIKGDKRIRPPAATTISIARFQTGKGRSFDPEALDGPENDRGVGYRSLCIPFAALAVCTAYPTDSDTPQPGKMSAK